MGVGTDKSNAKTQTKHNYFAFVLINYSNLGLENHQDFVWINNLNPLYFLDGKWIISFLSFFLKYCTKWCWMLNIAGSSWEWFMASLQKAGMTWASTRTKSHHSAILTQGLMSGITANEGTLHPLLGFKTEESENVVHLIKNLLYCIFYNWHANEGINIDFRWSRHFREWCKMIDSTGESDTPGLQPKVEHFKSESEKWKWCDM